MGKVEPQFRDLADSLPHMVWTCDADGLCDYLSRQWVEYTGLPAEVQLGQRWLEQLHPDDVELTKARWAVATASGEPFDTEYRIRRFDGVYRWFKTRAVPSRDSSGNIVEWFGTNTDIQELRDAQEATTRLNRELEERVAARTNELRAANERLETLALQLQTAQRVANVGSWELDVATGHVIWSDELFRIFRLDPSGGPPRLPERRAMFEPESRARLERAIERSIATGEGYELILAARCADGVVRTTVARAEAIRGRSGRVERLVGTFQDISAHERTAQELKRLSDRLQLATSAAKIGVWEWGIDTGVLVWDETMRAIYETPSGRERARFETWHDAVHPEDLARVDGALDGTLSGSGSYDITFRIVCPSGKIKHVHAAGALERDATGSPVRMIGVNWDITEQRVAEMALRRTEALQRAILAYAGPAVIATRLDGTITLFNRAAEELLGYTADEVVGETTPLLIHDSDEVEARREELERELDVPITPPFQVFVAKSRREGAEAREWTYVRKDGSRVPVLLTVTNLRDESGTITGYLGVAVNLTQQKAHERELLELNRLLADRSTQMEVLLQEIHHRVKNNLQVIASLVSLQARRVGDASTREALSECKTRILAIALIHEQLYQSDDYSRIPFSEYAEQLARNVFAASGTEPDLVNLVLDIEKLALPVEKAIPCGLILNELITNALKHAFPGNRRGTVEVSLRSVGSAELTLSVADDGVGLGEGFSLQRSRSLGMQLISDLSRQIDARITIASNGGAKISVTMPYRREAARHGASPAASSA